MPIRETLNAKPATLADILTNGKRYIVPPFQRDYAWDDGEWAELWADLKELHKATDDRNHYLGALVVQPTGERSDRRIIDGQQRLVTLSLLALAVIGRIARLAELDQDKENNLERVRILRERFVSSRDSASLQYRSRIQLNQTDDPFYRTYLVQGRVPARPAALRGSEERLYKAFRYFDREIEVLLGKDAPGASLASFVEDTVAARLRFIEIVVEDDETAFTVFETLNARGVALGTADLLKNYVFSVAAKRSASDLEQAQVWWGQILRLIPMEDLATFLFHKLAPRVAEMREKRVFAEIKAIVPRQQSVFDFLQETKESAEIYSALDDPHGEFWNDFPDARAPVRVLKILRVEQIRPVILAAFPVLMGQPAKIARLMQILVVISLRAVVARRNTGDLQRVYHSAARKIAEGALKSPASIARALADVYSPDEDFINDFSQLTLDPKGNRKHLVRYLLTELERASGGKGIDFDSSDATIEHILPENPGSSWEAFSAEDMRRDVRRLGNLTPLEYTLNKGLGAAEYERKLEVYKQSGYRLTARIAAAHWTPDTIRARQREMAQLAAAIWRIDLEDSDRAMPNPGQVG